MGKFSIRVSAPNGVFAVIQAAGYFQASRNRAAARRARWTR
jgi:hypothetical protein